jgi:competence protein ComEA
MPPERRAVLLVLGLAALGQGLRLWIGRPDAPPGGIELFDGGIPSAPGAHRDSSVTLARPLRLGERVDLDRASAAEIARLPRIGPRLARTIVANREAHGPFGSLVALDRVPGIGPGLLQAIGEHVSFSAVGRFGGSSVGGSATPPGASRSGNVAPVSEGVAVQAGLTVEPSNRRTVDLNTATVQELERLPFIGPSLARRIIAHRERHGRFPAVDSLVRVPGIGPATVAKIRDLVKVD